MSRFFNFLFKVGDIRHRANEIKADPIKCEKSKKYGIISIILSIVAFALSCLSLLLGMAQNSALVLLFLVVVIIFCIAGPIILLIYSSVYAFAQLSVNKKIISWLAIIFLVAALIGSIVVILHGFSLF